MSGADSPLVQQYQTRRARQMRPRVRVSLLVLAIAVTAVSPISGRQVPGPREGVPVSIDNHEVEPSNQGAIELETRDIGSISANGAERSRGL